MRQTTLLLLLILTVAKTSAADAILLADGRVIWAYAEATANGHNVTDDLRDASSLFVPFNATLVAHAQAPPPGSSSGGINNDSAAAIAGGTQNSVITPAGFSGSGAFTAATSAVSDPNSQDEIARSLGASIFHVQFLLSEPHNFTWSGGGTVSAAGGAQAWAFFGLAGQSGLFQRFHCVATPTDFCSGVNEPRPFFDTGTLPASSSPYVLSADAGVQHSRDLTGIGDARGDSSFTFNFTLTPVTTPVPEPGSVLLLGGGLTAVARKLRRRKAER